eukprot:1143795-Pelagomonas_calceolata.AAC.5
MIHAKHLTSTTGRHATVSIHQQRVIPHARCISARATTHDGCTGIISNRRALLSLFGIASGSMLLHGEPAVASDFGNSLAKIWRDRQKANIDICECTPEPLAVNAICLFIDLRFADLAPIRLSIRKLTDASALLQESSSSSPGTVYQEALQVNWGLEKRSDTLCKAPLLAKNCCHLSMIDFVST